MTTSIMRAAFRLAQGLPKFPSPALRPAATQSPVLLSRLYSSPPYHPNLPPLPKSPDRTPPEHGIAEDEDESIDDLIASLEEEPNADPDVLSVYRESAEHVSIIGAGITGLSTAYFLAREAPRVKIDVFEAADRVGGWMQTEEVVDPVSGGKILFETGPKTLRSLTSTPTRADDFVLADLLISLGLHPCVAVPSPKFVVDVQPPRTPGGPPESHLLRIPPPLIVKQLYHPAWKGWAKAVFSFWLLSLKVRFGIVGMPKVTDDTSVAEWLRSLKLGKEHGAPIIESMMSAMAHGIYGGDLEKLSVQSFLGPRFFQLYRRDQPEGTRMVPVEDAMIMKELGADESIVDYIKYMGFGESLVFLGGMKNLIGALESALESQDNITIHRNTPVSSVVYDPDLDKVTVITSPPAPGVPTTLTADRVISTIFSRYLSQIAKTPEGKPALPSLSDRLAVTVANIAFHFPTTIPLPENYSGVLPLPSCPPPVLGVFVESNLTGPSIPSAIRAHEAPGTKLSVLVGGTHFDHIPRSELPDILPHAETAARTFLTNILGITENPTTVHATLNIDCIPQHPPGHRAVMATAHRELISAFHGRLSAIGGSYTGIGVLPAIRAAYMMAQQIAYGAEEAEWSSLAEIVGVTGLEEFEGEMQWEDVGDERLAEWGKKTKYSVVDERDLQRVDRFFRGGRMKETKE